jgi:DNA-binding LacI/PurR family transcriptional regulator
MMTVCSSGSSSDTEDAISPSITAPVTAGFADQEAQARATYAVTHRRLAGYRAATERHGIDWMAVQVWVGTDSAADQGDAGGAAVFGSTPRPTALRCLSGRLAQGALRAAAKFGLLIPDDISIVGFDDPSRSPPTHC